MAKKSNTPATATTTEVTREARATQFIPASELCIPGLTREAVNSEPYYDPNRLKLPIDASNVAKLAATGNTRDAGLPPITVVEAGTERIVEDGRRRVREALAAQELRGGTPVLVECFVGTDKGLSDSEKFLRVRKANSRRINDSPLALAMECQRAKRDFGISLVKFAAEMGVGEHQMRMNMVLTKLDLRLVELLDKGEITPTFAIQLAKVSDNGDEQVAAYEELKGKGMATVAGVKTFLADKVAAAEPTAPAEEGKVAAAPAEEKSGPVRKGEVPLTLAEMRKLVASSKVLGFVCPIEPEVLAALKVLVGETKPEAGPKGLAMTIQAMREGVLPQPVKQIVTPNAANSAPATAPSA